MVAAMSSQLDRWAGDFGTEYTDRNQPDWGVRLEGFKQVLPADSQFVLEVGCNRGHNMLAMRELGKFVYGYEPNNYARGLAHDAGLVVAGRSVYDLPGTPMCDLVLTSGVLIHVPPERLDEALTNLHGVTSKYILAIEYAGADEAVEYRGHTDMLWKRDYGAHYQRLFPELELIHTAENVVGFDGATWWLLQK